MQPIEVFPSKQATAKKVTGSQQFTCRCLQFAILPFLHWVSLCTAGLMHQIDCNVNRYWQIQASSQLYDYKWTHSIVILHFLLRCLWLSRDIMPPTSCSLAKRKLKQLGVKYATASKDINAILEGCRRFYYIAHLLHSLLWCIHRWFWWLCTVYHCILRPWLRIAPLVC